MTTFERSIHLDRAPAEVYAWHLRAGAFERLTPPGSGVRTLEGPGPIAEGDRRTLSVPVLGPVRRRWVAVHRDFVAGERFVDEAERGPFAEWRHEHRFEPAEGGGCLHTDHIEYREPLGTLGRLLVGRMVRRQLESMFTFRHRRLALDLRRHAAFADRPRMKVAITGASGLVGRQLAAFLTTGGHTVRRLVRRSARGPDEIAWDPSAGTVDQAALEGVDAIVHLAGENIAGGRWSESRKERIRASRIDGTRTIATAASQLTAPPRALISASAVGWYGDAGEAEVDETTPAHPGFLGTTCAEWEAAADPAREAGVRVVHPRIGIVVTADGGALQKMLTPFWLGAGGRLGSGRQWMSWIALDDLLGLLHHALFDDSLSGPVNAAAPHPARNADFTRTLASVLRRPAILPAPAFALRLLLGEMADALLLTGANVRSTVLPATTFEFAFPELEDALRFELQRFA